MLATARPLPTTDELFGELITTSLKRVDKALEGLDKPLTVARHHAIRQDLTVVKDGLITLRHLHDEIALLTPPLRPEEVG